MASVSAQIADDRNVYRGMRNWNWVKGGIVTYKAYLLRPASDKYAAEEKLSLGLTPEAAIKDLHEQHGVAELSVYRVHLLHYGLRVMSDPEDETKAYMHGLPPHSQIAEQLGRSISIATELASISRFIPAP